MISGAGLKIDITLDLLLIEESYHAFILWKGEINGLKVVSLKEKLSTLVYSGALKASFSI